MDLLYLGIMRILLAALVCWFTAAAAVADVFKYTDPDGNVVYTDQPREGAERLKLPEISTYKNRAPPRLAEPEPKRDAEQTVYGRFVITQPAQDATVWDSGGNLSVKIEADPALKVGAGHRVVVSLDGAALPGTFDSTEFTLTNIDRGTHRVSASVVDSSGRTVASAAAVTFHMKRQSQLLRQRKDDEPKPVDPENIGNPGVLTDNPNRLGPNLQDNSNVKSNNPNKLSNNPNFRTNNPNVINPNPVIKPPQPSPPPNP